MDARPVAGLEPRSHPFDEALPGRVVRQFFTW
jgi:hypothetical protein